MTSETYDLNHDLHDVLGAIEGASSSPELLLAVQRLADLQLAQGIPTLIKVLGYNNPSVAVIAMGGLIRLGAVAVPELLSLMDDYNYGARAYTVRALGAIADPRGLDCLIDCALHDFAPSVRRAAIKGLGAIAQKIQQTTGSVSSAILATLIVLLRDEDWSIRYGAIVSLSKIPQAREILGSGLAEESDRVVRARISLALDCLKS